MTRTSHPLTRFRAHRAGSPAGPLAAAPGPVAVPAPGGATAEREWAELSMEIRRDGRRPVVAVSGELDLAGKDLLEAMLAHVRSTHSGTVAVDLAQVSFVDTHGVSPVLGRDVVLVAASPAVRRLLRLLGLPLPGPVPDCSSPRRGRWGRPPGHR